MSSSTLDIPTSLQAVQASVAQLAQKYGRDPASIQLLAVSKTKPLTHITAAIDAGQQAFGENYPDEAFEKIDELGPNSCQWHFIGAIQSRKCAGIAKRFDWVHGIDRLKVAKKLAQHRPAELAPLQCCLQVNIDNESSKAGVSPETVFDLAAQIAELPQLTFRGLMAIPAQQTDIDRQRDAFARVRLLFEALQKTYLDLDTLSMGMSGDLEAAIAEGATIVRVGTAIFGARTA